MRTAAVIAALGLLTLATPATADAKAVRCQVGEYLLVDPNGTPSISRLRAVHLPRRTDGYAPRCLVAEAIASLIQMRFQARGRLPDRVHPYGARWDGGVFRCRYRDRQTGNVPFGRAICRKAGKPRRRVTMRLGS